MSHYDDERKTLVLDDQCLVADCKRPRVTVGGLEFMCKEHIAKMKNAAAIWAGSREMYENHKDDAQKSDNWPTWLRKPSIGQTDVGKQETQERVVPTDEQERQSAVPKEAREERPRQEPVRESHRGETQLERAEWRLEQIRRIAVKKPTEDTDRVWYYVERLARSYWTDEPV